MPPCPVVVASPSAARSRTKSIALLPLREDGPAELGLLPAAEEGRGPLLQLRVPDLGPGPEPLQLPEHLHVPGVAEHTGSIGPSTVERVWAPPAGYGHSGVDFLSCPPPPVPA